MKSFVIQYSKVVRLNCTVFIDAESEEEALKKCKDGDYEHDHYDESEVSVISEDEPNIEEVE